MSRTIAFVHGNFVTRRCWDRWMDRFQARGHTCVAIAYPGRDGSVEELRRSNGGSGLGSLDLPQVVEHHVRALRSLGEKPIVIGHSFGGLLTQLLVQRDLAAAAVAIDSVPPPGVLAPSWSFLRSTWPVLNPFVPASRPYLMSFPALPVHLRQRPAVGGAAARIRAGGGAGVAPPGARGALPSRPHPLPPAARAPAPDRGREGPHHAAGAEPGQLPPLPEVRSIHNGIQGVSGTRALLHSRWTRLGRGGGLRAGLGDESVRDIAGRLCRGSPGVKLTLASFSSQNRCSRRVRSLRGSGPSGRSALPGLRPRRLSHEGNTPFALSRVDPAEAVRRCVLHEELQIASAEYRGMEMWWVL